MPAAMNPIPPNLGVEWQSYCQTKSVAHNVGGLSDCHGETGETGNQYPVGGNYVEQDGVGYHGCAERKDVKLKGRRREGKFDRGNSCVQWVKG